MSDTIDGKKFGKPQAPFTNKRCPYCYTHLKLNAVHCMECRQKVGKVDSMGLARKPFNYKAYLAALLWVVFLGIYFWKIFIEKLVASFNASAG